MKRLTKKDDRGYYLTGDGIYSDWGVPEKFRGEDIDRLAAIEDILGDEYDLERMRLLLENDKSCYTCKNYKGEKICGFKGLDVEINPQEGCSVRKAALRREQE